MIVNMSRNATEEQIEHVIERIKECGFQPHVIRGAERTVIGAVGSGGRRAELEALQAAPGVEELVPISQPFKLVSRQLYKERTVVDVGGVKIGGEQYIVMAGPCSVESREQLLSTARAVRDAGGSILRGGAYKPRTSPYDFQGLGVEALELLKEARQETGLPIVTEVMSTEDVDLVSEYADMLQVGARNMQNFPLAAAAGAGGEADPAEARTFGDGEGVAAGGGVSAERRQSECGALRARDQDVRVRAAQHVRPGGGGVGEGAFAPAGGGRSFARDGAAQRDSSDEPRGDRRGRGRNHRGSASLPGARAFRRAAVAGPEGVRDADGGAGPAGADAGEGDGEGLRLMAAPAAQSGPRRKAAISLRMTTGKLFAALALLRLSV